jgi:hypothetical protein
MQVSNDFGAALAVVDKADKPRKTIKNIFIIPCPILNL